jgi:hypothetical protein
MTASVRDDEHVLSSSYVLPSQASGSSLAQHYIPGKITPSPSYWGSEARRAGRKAAGGWGAAAGSRRVAQEASTSASASIRGNGVLFRPAYQEYVESSGSSSAIFSPSNPLGHKDPFSSSTASILGPPSSGHRNRKSGRGREAWGKDGAGDPALGAGNFEDDDGLDLSHEDQDGEHALSAEESSTPPLSRSAGQSSLLPSIIAVSVKAKQSRVRWNKFKWTLVAANTIVSGLGGIPHDQVVLTHLSLQLTLYSLIGFVAVILFWTGMYRDSRVLDVINRTEMACECGVDKQQREGKADSSFLTFCSGLGGYDAVCHCLHCRLGGHPTQQPIFSVHLHFPTLDRLHFHRSTWLHCLQEAYLQLERQNESILVKWTLITISATYTTLTPLLWLLLAIH